jgi:hypothetical protein
MCFSNQKKNGCVLPRRALDRCVEKRWRFLRSTGQRGGWGAFVRMDEAEIAAANRLASDRADDLTAVATGGGAVVRNVGGGGQRKRTLVQAKLVGAPDRSMPVYAADGTTVPPPPLRIV